jgi:hypothetical protein
MGDHDGDTPLSMEQSICDVIESEKGGLFTLVPLLYRSA